MPSCIPVYMYACMYVLGVFSTHQNNSQNQCVRNGRWHCGPVKDASVGLLFGDSGNHTARRHTSLENEGDPVVLSRSSLVGVSAKYGGPGLTGWQILSCRMDTSLSPGDFDKQEGILRVGAAIFFVVAGGDRSLANFRSSAVGVCVSSRRCVHNVANLPFFGQTRPSVPVVGIWSMSLVC